MKSIIGTSSGFILGAVAATALSMSVADKGDILVELNPVAVVAVADAGKDLTPWLLKTFGVQASDVVRFTCHAQDDGAWQCAMIAQMSMKPEDAEAIEAAGGRLRVIGAVNSQE